jgi:RimJ/RimL family protein N-acetyltransferase
MKGPAYRIVTPRLVLRCWDPRDAPRQMEAVAASLDHLRPWMPWAHDEPISLDDRVALLRGWRAKFDLDQDFYYGVFSPDESLVLGSTGLHTRDGRDTRMIGYWIHVDHIGRGYATELSAALTRVAFEVEHMTRVDIFCAVDNARSAAVPRKLGYTLDATLRRRESRPDGPPRDMLAWSLFADEFPATPSASAPVEAYDAMGRRIL